MFLGEFQHTLDPKGRVILPSTFRDSLKEGLVMTVGLDHCVAVYPESEWESVVAGLRNLRATEGRERAFARMILAYAHQEIPDRQGRVTVPARLRNYAGLDRETTVVGNDARVELWNTEGWQAYRDRAIEDFATTDQAFNLGIF